MFKATVGFFFSEDEKQIVLIRKNRPQWQKDCLNGIGGKIEGEETPLECMKREFLEETSLSVEDWIEVGKITAKDAEINIFTCKGDVSQCKTVTDEEVLIVEVANLSNYKLISNLPTIIPACLSKFKTE